MSPIIKVRKVLTKPSRRDAGKVVEHDGRVTARCGCGMERHWLEGPRAHGSAQRWLSRHTHQD